MSNIDYKNQCNSLYGVVLRQLESKEDLNSIHKNLIKMVEYLIEIGKRDSSQKNIVKAKIELLWDIIKSMNKNTAHTSIYFQLTGELLPQDNEEEKINIEENTTELEEDKIYDSVTNRIQKLSDFIGQERIKQQIKEAIDAAKIKNDALDHTLLFGQPGLGKTSLSRIIANEMKSNIIFMSGPTIKNSTVFIPIFNEIKEGDILFIDEIHRINISAAESLYTAMEDYIFTYIDTKESDANITIRLPKFTVIGATTHSGLLDKPFRDRFNLQFKLSLYTPEELTKVTLIKMNELGYKVGVEAAWTIANRSKGVPRILHGYIKRIIDRAIVNEVKTIDYKFVENYFSDNGISKLGLADVDIAYLSVLYGNKDKKAMGLDNISSVLGENKDIIESQVEPYLIYLGFIQITSSGRVITEAGVNFIEGKEYE